MIDADADGRQTKSHRGDTARRIGSAVVLDQAIIGIGFVPEKVERGFLDLHQKGAVVLSDGLASGRFQPENQCKNNNA